MQRIGCLLIGWSTGPTYKWAPTSGRSIKLVRVEVDFTSRLEVYKNDIDHAKLYKRVELEFKKYRSHLLLLHNVKSNRM